MTQTYKSSYYGYDQQGKEKYAYDELKKKTSQLRIGKYKRKIHKKV